jgi:hypothetical protein
MAHSARPREVNIPRDGGGRAAELHVGVERVEREVIDKPTRIGQLLAASQTSGADADVVSPDLLARLRRVLT